MTELKTLKDLERHLETKNHNVNITDNIGNFVLSKELKTNAIKWVKELERRWNIRPSNVEPFQIEWIKHFFDISEEDLK